MARLSHHAEYIAVRVGFGIINLLSDGAADRLAVWLGRIVWRLLSSRRKIAAANLRLSFAGQMTEAEIEQIVYEVFINLSRTFVEFARVKKVGPEGLRARIIPNGQEILQKLHEEGKGAIFLTAHFGNWEWTSHWVAAQGYQFSAMAKIQHNLMVDRFVTSLRESLGVRIIKVDRKAARSIMKELKANHFVGILPDQHDPSEALVLNFLGRPATIARGPAFFAVKAGCPVIPFLMRRESSQRHVLIPGQPIYPEATGDMEAEIRRISELYLRFFEENIRKYPEQWMWTHRRWKIS